MPPNYEWCSHHPKSKPISPNHRVAWYRRERAKWIAHLGGKCAICGTTEELEFDHDAPRDWQPNKLSRWTRMKHYIADIKAGKIKQLLCRHHNAIKGYPQGQQELLDSAAVKQQAEEPF